MEVKNRNILFNSIFWVLYFLYEWLGQGSLEDEYYRYFINACMVVPTAFLASYLSVHFLFRHYYIPDKKAFWIGQILVALAFVLIRRTFHFHYTYPLYYPQAISSQSFLFIPKLIIEFVNLYLIVSVYGMFYFIRSWYEQQSIMQELKQEKTTAELQLLKSQVHPHFIFNTLNNIYAVTFKKSPETANYLLKLASFLDYNLYNSQQEYVGLEEELDYIQNFVALQKLRFGEKVDVSFHRYGKTDNLKIAPLLLLPLIENCFKHGVGSSVEDSWVRVEVSGKEGEINFKIENSKEPNCTTGSKNGGLGLENVKKRLELIYPGCHELRLFEEPNAYLALLKIKIN